MEISVVQIKASQNHCVAIMYILEFQYVLALCINIKELLTIQNEKTIIN